MAGWHNLSIGIPKPPPVCIHAKSHAIPCFLDIPIF